MLKIDRERIIEETLQKHGSLLISSISKEIKCSEETIRRDLARLEKEGKLTRIHGGAYISEDFDKSVPIQIREYLFSNVKNEMATVALNNFVHENDTIIIDSSTTCLALAKLILESNIKVTIITNSFRLCKLAESHPNKVKVICTGGRFRFKHGGFGGQNTIDAINHYFADSCFISPPAINKEFGLLDNSNDLAAVRKSIIKHSKNKYFIADHTKFTEKAESIISKINALDAIITDNVLEKEWIELTENNNINVLYSN